MSDTETAPAPEAESAPETAPETGAACRHCNGLGVFAGERRCRLCGKSQSGRRAQSPEERAKLEAQRAAKVAEESARVESAPKPETKADAPAKVPKPRGRPPAAKAPKTLSKDARDRLQRTLAKSFGFVGELAFEIAAHEPVPDFGERRAGDLADAWLDIVAEYLPENAEGTVKWALALGATGQIVVSCAREIRKHNAAHPLPPKAPESAEKINGD